MEIEALISTYGLFWRVDELKWARARGRKSTLRLLGRRGKGSTFRIADFRTQSGLYVLYGDYGPYYVGLVHANRLGNRLRDHLKDHHKGKWDRFSWFGFRHVLPTPNDQGVCILKDQKPSMPVGPKLAIRDIEALLIRALGLSSNVKRSGFVGADQWIQIKEHQVDEFLALARRPRR
jgi:hypothetical protein